MGRSSRRSRIVRRTALRGLAVLLVPVGLAQLAQNTVPVTRADQSAVPITIATSISARDVDHGSAQPPGAAMVATLDHWSGPLTGAPIDFWVGGEKVCTGVPTDASGRANCTAYPAGPLPPTYRAVFEGQGPFRRSEATGQLLRSPGAG